MTSTAPVRFRPDGRRVPKRAPSLRFGAIRRGGVVAPVHPDQVDYLAHIAGGLQLFENDRIGDCAAITWANCRYLITTGLTGSPRYPSLDDVLALYRTQNPGFDPNGDPAVDGPGSPEDGGMDLQTLLEYLHAEGGPDGVKPVAFAQVDTTDPDELRAAVAIFGAVWFGVLVQDAQQDQFAAGADWSWVEGSPVEGGHAILAGGYDPQRVKVAGWAAEYGLADGYVTAALEEAWVVIWPEHLGSVEFLTGVDLSALAGAYRELTGRDVVLTPPAPAPVPVPVDPAPVVGPAPVDPDPVDPTPGPVDPAPVDPAPVPVDPTPLPAPVPEPEPAPEPEPVDPTPVDPSPVDPAPVDPTPQPEPDPTPQPEPEPDPVVPDPVVPDPVDPDPVDPGDDPDPVPPVWLDYPWKAADAFLRNPHHHLVAEHFRGKLIEWAANLPE